MSDSDPRLTRSVVPLILKEHDGAEVELAFRPFSDDDFVEYDAWLRSLYMARVEASCNGLSARFVSAAIAQALKEVASIGIFDAHIGHSIFTTIDGMIHALWISCRDDSDLEEADFRRLLSLKPNQIKTANHWADVNLGPVDKKGKKGKKGKKSGESSPVKKDTSD